MYSRKNEYCSPRLRVAAQSLRFLPTTPAQSLQFSPNTLPYARQRLASRARPGAAACSRAALLGAAHAVKRQRRVVVCVPLRVLIARDISGQIRVVEVEGLQPRASLSAGGSAPRACRMTSRQRGTALVVVWQEGEGRVVQRQHAGRILLSSLPDTFCGVAGLLKNSGPAPAGATR